MLWARVAFVALAASACAAPLAPASPGVGAQLGGDSPLDPASTPATEAVLAASSVEVRVEPEAPTAPEGAVCVVRGTGRPDVGMCGSPLILSDTRSGGRPIAQVAVGGFPISWGFFADGGRAWVHAESDGVSASGYTPHAGERFSIRGELEAVPGHVWLFDETAVRVKQGVEGGGALVSVHGDLDGVADMSLKIPCEVLGYDMLPRASARIGRSSPVRRGPRAVAKGKRLTLRGAPQDAPFVTLKTDGETLPVSLEVREALGDWARVRLETRSVRLDGWVLDREIERNRLAATVGRGRVSCGVAHAISRLTERVKLSEDATLSVGPKGRIAPAPSLAIAKGTEVLVEARGDGLARVTLPGSISPPPGAGFYLPESVLDPLPVP
jgi:hypothetical protein